MKGAALTRNSKLIPILEVERADFCVVFFLIMIFCERSLTFRRMWCRAVYPLHGVQHLVDVIYTKSASCFGKWGDPLGCLDWAMPEVPSGIYSTCIVA